MKKIDINTVVNGRKIEATVKPKNLSEQKLSNHTPLSE